MKLNPAEMKRRAGDEEYALGKDLEEAGWVRLLERNRDYARYQVAGNPAYPVTITRSLQAECSCEAFRKNDCCRHVVAVWLAAERDRLPDSILRLNAPERGRELSDLVLTSMPEEPVMRLEITLALPRRERQPLRIGLRIGQAKLYVVTQIPDFLDAWYRGETRTFGRGLVFEGAWMRFPPEDELFLDWMRKLRQAEPETVSGNARMLPVPEFYTEEMMNLLSSREFRMMDQNGNMIRCSGIQQARLPLRFDMLLGPRGLSLSGRIPTDFQPLTENASWAVLNGTCIQVDPEQRELVRLLYTHQYDGKCLIDYPLSETERVIGEVLPYLKLRGSVEISQELRRRLVQRPLKSAVYLDRDGQSVLATVEFRYGETVLNPFAPVAEKITLSKGERLLLRDAEAEHTVLEILSHAGFRVRKEHILLRGNDAVFDFISEGVRKLQECSEVYFSREFKRLMPRRATLSGNMRLRGDQLEFFLDVDGEPTEEILELIEALSRKRRYFRLKDGQFLDLQALASWQEIASTIYEAAVRDGNDVNRGILTLRSYRAAYLSSMLQNCGVSISQDEEVQRLSDALAGRGEAAPLPTMAPGVQLRDYQRRGYEWLVSMDRMHMGGILADDMGLGKTIQVIAFLSSVQAPGRTSLVVAPTSLTYNWLSEIRRFAPELSAAVLGGPGERRGSLIRHVKEHGDVDVLITSYPLIRRDIDQMKDCVFRTVILDEAQNIKNAGSVAAGAVKQLQAESRFALTGTPMENGVGELWSLFDFVLPGYLPGYHYFVRKYQDGENSEDLLRRIQPFLIRRLKQDVLSELPEKIETTLSARMTPEQDKLYLAALERIRPRINQLVQEKGFSGSRMEVLSAITELREICCHPVLVMEDYRGSSGKEELLLDILPELIGSGRRILLFSQFTRMLKLLQTRLEENGYSTLYLDGDTPAGDRLTLSERFNRGEGEIFLISLRAGGSGLNLTGADLVIHYDPWWNPATEDQATDRAHRIGQTHTVDVIRLVTAQSIEEQVVELGVRKKALFDRLITPGESTLSILSEQDIRNLFS